MCFNEVAQTVVFLSKTFHFATYCHCTCFELVCLHQCKMTVRMLVLIWALSQAAAAPLDRNKDGKSSIHPLQGCSVGVTSAVL